MKTLEKVSDFVGKYMAVIVIVVAALALLFPGTFSVVKTAWVNTLLGIVMFGMGLTLKPEDFKVVFSRPKDVIIGCIAQFTLMPFLAWALTQLFHLPTELAIGVILVGTCPGGTSSNVMTMENKNMSRLVIGVLVVLVLLLGGYIAVSGTARGGKSAATANGSTGASEAAALPMETYQAQYVKPETPIDRSKNVTLPGWGGFTIPAKTKKITQGFEFHNPAENLWYEDWVSIDGTPLEKLVVDSGQTAELSHYLRLAGIQADVTKVLDADPAFFDIQKNDAGAYTIEAVKGYKGEKTLTVQTDDGKQYTLTLTGKEECYYIAFGLYLEEGDELLFQSGLVAPGLYVQKMEMARALAPGEYPAYVVCQPYLSDRATKTNSGIVKLTLTVG